MRKHLKIKITGKVQGVGFRYSTKVEADKLGIFGSAGNLPDGSVFIEAEGEEKDLEEFLKWSKVGPWVAEVIDVTVEEQSSPHHFSEFTIY